MRRPRPHLRALALAPGHRRAGGGPAQKAKASGGGGRDAALDDAAGGAAVLSQGGGAARSPGRWKHGVRPRYPKQCAVVWPVQGHGG